MPASKVNYLVIYKQESQVFGSASKEIALKSPPPQGLELKDKRILYVTYQPDEEILSVYQVPMEEVLSAEIEYPKRKSKEDGQEEKA